MNIPWKLKSLIFKFIDVFNTPGLLYFLQKYVTKRSVIGKLRISPIWEAHKEYLKQYSATEKVFEFGAGKSLAQNFYISDIAKTQVVVDLNPMLDFELVNEVRCQISEIIDLKSQGEINSYNELASYGIDYKAPYDASNTLFTDKFFSACISTNTLEHIPKADIENIFVELYRILKDDGIISAKIDYSDHYSHTDKTISLLNYLSFDENTWKKYNHRCHYQNRLRHYDYIEIFNKCGFFVVAEHLVYSENNIPRNIIKAFENKDEKWKATSAHILLKKSL